MSSVHFLNALNRVAKHSVGLTCEKKSPIETSPVHEKATYLAMVSDSPLSEKYLSVLCCAIHAYYGNHVMSLLFASESLKL